MTNSNISQRKALLELAKRAERKKFRKYPEQWMVQKFGYDARTVFWDLWGTEYEDHEWDGDINPFLIACRTLSGRVKGKKHVAIESATSCGKTYFLPVLIYWFLDCFENSVVVTTAPTLIQLKTVLWAEIQRSFFRFKKIRKKAEIYSLGLFPDGKKLGEELTEDSLTDMYCCYGKTSNSSRADETSTAFQGIHREHLLAVIDEAPGITHGDFNSLVSTTTAARNHIIAVGNPDSQTDPLHTFSNYSNVQSVRISALDHPNIVLKKEVIPGAVSVESIQMRATEYGEESNIYKSRVRGLAPKQGAESLIKYDWIAQCCVGFDEWHEANERFGPIKRDPERFNAVGIDVSNSEAGDKACTAFGRNNLLDRLDEFYCRNANDLARNVVLTDDDLYNEDFNVYNCGKIKDYNIHENNIGVDAVGVGVATVNTFLDLGYDVLSLQGGPNELVIPKDAEDKPMWGYVSLRAQMYHLFALCLQRREIEIDLPRKVAEQLIKEATIPKMMPSENKIVIEKKDSIIKQLGASPNKLDAVVYWNYAGKFGKELVYEMPIG